MIMAVENEFGIAGGNSLGRATVIQNEVKQSMPSIPSKWRGVFLANGSRVYVDAGYQPEYCTPEASDPAEVVIHELAGRRIMGDAASRAGQSLLCSNVDPVHSTTWGSHENYSSVNPIVGSSAVMPLLIHLATRIPFAGTGGLSVNHSGFRIIMSPRMEFMKACVGQQGIDRRTLIFHKQTNHGRLYRNHIICGENLLSHYAGYLKYATTALIVACVDAGLLLSDIRFRQPLLKVISQVNRDLNMQRLYELSDGRRFTVLDVQDALLDSVEINLPHLPAWAPRAVQRWRQVIAHLRGGYGILNTRIDWMLYRNLVTELCGELGMDSGDLVKGGRLGPIADQSKQMEFKAYANELYLRLHLLNGESLFEQLEAENRLDHHLSEISEQAVERAMSYPPAGRAVDRVNLIHTYWREKGLKMTWATLEDHRPQPSSNPIKYQGDAIKIILAGSSEQRQRHVSIVDQAETFFRRGDYNKALELYRSITRLDQLDNERHSAETICLSFARAGNKDGALQMLDVHAELSPVFVHQVYRLFCAINFGLKPPKSTVREILRECDVLLSDQSESLDDFGYHRLILEQCRAFCLNSAGQPAEAAALCKKLLANPHHTFRTRMTARTRCFYATALLSQGKKMEASDEICQAIRTHIQEELHADLATYSYPLMARIQSDDVKARAILHKAESSLRQLDNPLGLARVLCIKARRLETSEDLEELKQLRNQCNALKDCVLAEQIINHWGKWIAPPNASTPDDYWGM